MSAERPQSWQHLRCGAITRTKGRPLVCRGCGERCEFTTGWTLKPVIRQVSAPKGKAKRQRIYDRDDRACVECGSTDDLTLDHITPRSKGGGNEDSNLQTMCSPCNRRKGNRLPAIRVLEDVAGHPPLLTAYPTTSPTPSAASPAVRPAGEGPRDDVGTGSAAQLGNQQREDGR